MSDKNKILAQAVGRRKRAIASVRLTAGGGQIIVNGQPVSVYFPGLLAKAKYERPFKVTGVSKYDASVKVFGGGPTGQLDALVLGLARCLTKIKIDHKRPLRQGGLLTRDSRSRQRRMVGMGGKSRRRKQSPKR